MTHSAGPEAPRGDAQREEGQTDQAGGRLGPGGEDRAYRIAGAMT